MMELVFNDPRFLWDQTPLGLGQVAHSRNTLIQTWEQSSSIEIYFTFFVHRLNCFQQKKGRNPSTAPENDKYNVFRNQYMSLAFLVLIECAANIWTIVTQNSVNILLTMNKKEFWANIINLYLVRWNLLKYLRTDFFLFLKTMTF